MSIENVIIEKIKELLPEVNTGNTLYHYNWSNCTINKDLNDVNSVPNHHFPYVDIEFIEEVCDNAFNNTQWHANILTMQLDCIPTKKNTTRENIDEIIQDIKRFFGNNNNLGGTVFAIGYDRYRRFTAQTQGNFYGVRITFKVKYFEDKINP